MSRLNDVGLLVPAFRERLERALLVVRGQGSFVRRVLAGQER